MMNRQLMLLFLLISAPAFFDCETVSKNQNFEAVYYKVSKVVDGDTFWIDDGTEKGEKIRLIGIDAPESRNTGKKVKQFYGEEAKEYLTQFILGKDIKLEYDIDKKDQYQRTLAYAYLKDGTFLNAHLIENGYATVMTISPNNKYADQFHKLQVIARENKRGLWK